MLWFLPKEKHVFLKKNLLCDMLLGCPRVLRTVPGTENVLLASVECTFSRNDSDELAGNASHRYGKSVFNQVCKIEENFILCDRSVL